MRYHRGSRRVTMEHFGNLHSHEEMHSVVGDEPEAILQHEVVVMRLFPLSPFP